MKRLIAVVVLTACDRQPPATSCNDDLRGMWVAPGGERWALLDHGERLEAFAAFDDAIADGAPRLVDLTRGEVVGGEVRRRYTRGGDHCEARAPMRVTACADNQLQVVRADPPPPLAYAPCRGGQAAPARVERWRRD